MITKTLATAAILHRPRRPERRCRRAASGGAGATSSARWRSERPPIVFDGEIRHWLRIRFALTRPYFGTARIMSKAFADSTYSGGSSSSVSILHLAGLQVALQLGARRCGSRWPCRSAFIRWSLVLSGTAAAVSTEAAIGRRRSYTRGWAARKGLVADFRRNSLRPQVEVDGAEIGRRGRCERPEAAVGARAAASSAATRSPASGSRKFAVPTATAVAPAARNSSASAPGLDPAHPDHRDRRPPARRGAPARSAIGRTAGPESPPLPAPSQGSRRRRVDRAPP